MATPTHTTAAALARPAWLRRLGPGRATALLLVVLASAQLLLASRLGLVTDEAHYALYGLHRDASYLDHPPLVGWLQALVLTVSSDAVALRLWAVVLSAVSGALLYALARRIFPDDSPWVGCGAVVLWSLAPDVHATGVVLVPEDALLPAALLVLHALVSVLAWGSPRQWLLLGVALGIAGLAKYTAAALVATVVGALLLGGRARDLRGPGPWIAVAAAALIVSPVVLWNASHDWISFRYQLRHGASGAWSAKDFLVSRAGELLTYGPALVVGGLVAGWQALRRERAHPGVRVLLLVALPVLLLFWPASGRETMLPHWTQLAWIGLSVLAARWYARAWVPGARRRLALGGVAYCVGVLIAVHLVLGHGVGPADPVGRVRAPFTGWDEAAATAVRLRAEMATRPGPPPAVFADHWSASRLAWYGRPVPVQIVEGRPSQFDLWFGRPEAGARGLFVDWESPGPPEDPQALRRFEHARLLEEQAVEEPGGRIATFRFWECDGYRP